MKPQWVWLSLGLLSALWAGAMWGSYELFGVLLSAMPAATHWLADFPLAQSLWESGIRLLGGIDGAVQVIAWILWAIGQVALLVLAWAALRFIPDHALQAIRNRLLQQRPHHRW